MGGRAGRTARPLCAVWKDPDPARLLKIMDSRSIGRDRTLRVGMVAVWAACAAAALAGAASARPDPDVIDRAAAIRADVTARYVSTQGLVVTEASSTDVVGSLTLWSADGAAVREVPTARGVYYALCPTRTTCPFPSRKRARPVAAFAPRRAALELALRSFSETTADPVVVSLPTRRWVLLVLERSELAASTGTAALDAGDDPRVAPTKASSSSGRRVDPPPSLYPVRPRHRKRRHRDPRGRAAHPVSHDVLGAQSAS